jgi:DNA (cytosine-5)-methyltransferase 1
MTGSGGGGTHGYHWAEPRALTNRERARLQTFPDAFEFRGTKESVRKQVGMAVPVLGAQRIFEALFKTFNGDSYASVASNLESHLLV